MSKSVNLSTYLLVRYAKGVMHHGIAGFSAAVVAAKGIPNPWITFVSFAATGLGGTATLVLNDYFDREVDRHIRPWRPIPSGKMEARSALILASILVAIGFLLTISLYNLTCLLVALSALVVALIYNASKRRRYVAHGVLALNPALCVVYGYAAVGALGLELTPLALIMALMLFTDNFSTAMVASVPDVVGDEMGGAVTAAVKLSVGKAAKLGLALLTTNIALGILPFMLGYLKVGYLLCFLTTRIVLFGVHVFFTKNPNRRFGFFTHSTQYHSRMCVFLSFIIGVLPTSVGLLLAPILCILMILTPINYYKYARLRKL